MSDMPATVLLRSDDGGDGRTVEVRIMPWGEAVDTVDGREMFERGAFASVDPSRVTIESQRHGGTLVGRGIGLEERDDAAYLHARISRTPAGDELLELIQDGVLSQASVAFKPVKSVRRKGVAVRQAVDLWRVAILERGNYPGAGVVAVRAQSEDDDMVDVAEAPVVADDGLAVRTALAPVMTRLDDMDSRIVRLATVASVVAPQAAPIEYRADTLGQLLAQAWGGTEQPMLRALNGCGLMERVLVDNISSANPGVVPPAIISRAATIVSFGRPAITAMGTDPLPASGMTVQWPVLTTPLTGLVAKQSAEKAAIASALVSFGNATATIQTFAGGADNSIQLIRRSDPPYLEQWARAMLAAWSLVTNAQFLTDLAAGATGGSVIILPTSTATQIVAALVDASIKVETATGQPATAVVVASDLFAAIAKVWAPTSINPTATGGTATASELSVTVSGLRIVHDRQLPAGTGFVSNEIAAQWMEDGPNQLSVTDVNKLGENMAYWSFGVTALYVPAGVVKIAAA